MLTVPSSSDPKHMPLFLGMTDHERNSLLAEGQKRVYARGKLIFAHGDKIASFYILLQGSVQLFRTTADGHQKTIHLLKAGQTICEDEIMDSCRTHRVNAMAVEEVTVLEFPSAWLKNTAKQHSTFALNLLSTISQQVHLAELEAEHQATMSAAQLVACFVQRLCVIYDFDPKGFELPYSKTLIASRLGMELETFSRTLAKLKEHGITVSGTRVAINDLERVEHYVCGMCSVSEDCATHQALEKRSCGKA